MIGEIPQPSGDDELEIRNRLQAIAGAFNDECDRIAIESAGLVDRIGKSDNPEVDTEIIFETGRIKGARQVIDAIKGALIQAEANRLLDESN